MQQTQNFLAPAKLNLSLHITGKRDNGYHELQSLITFIDVGDLISIQPQDHFSLEIKGPFSKGLCAEKDNLIYKAAHLLCEHYQCPLNGKITLTKNLPVAAGIGGGSSDAATSLKALTTFWGLPNEQHILFEISKKIGADVPACLYQKTLWAEGLGEEIKEINHFPEFYFVLVNPLVPTLTSEIFKQYKEPFHSKIKQPKYTTDKEWLDFLQNCKNDLTTAATQITPIVEDTLKEIKNTAHCRIQRLSGSGATCFGLYKTEEEATTAVATIKNKRPDWWVVSGKTFKN